MPLPNIFDASVVNTIVERINKLTPETQPLWGKMGVATMLAHSNVTYEMLHENTHKKPNGFVRFMLKTFVKKGVTNDVPYKKNSSTAPAFIIKDERNFEVEKKRLIDYMQKTMAMGRNAFEGKESLSFGAMTAEEWNNLFYKHLDHHLGQFGV